MTILLQPGRAVRAVGIAAAGLIIPAALVALAAQGPVPVVTVAHAQGSHTGGKGSHGGKSGAGMGGQEEGGEHEGGAGGKGVSGKILHGGGHDTGDSCGGCSDGHEGETGTEGHQGGTVGHSGNRGGGSHGSSMTDKVLHSGDEHEGGPGGETDKNHEDGGPSH